MKINNINNITYKNLIISILLYIISTTAWGYDLCQKYKGNMLYYNKIGNERLEITYQEYSNENYIKLRTLYIPATIEYNDTTYHVVGIGNSAFSGAKHLKKVTFHDEGEILFIKEGAFAGCQHLKTIEIPTTVTKIEPFTFAWTGIREITIHNSITSIGERAFTNCRQLVKINMGENIDSIYNFAFAWCDKIRSITIPEKTEYLGYEILQANSALDTVYYNAINCKTSGAYYDYKEDRIIGGFERNKRLCNFIIGNKVISLPPYLLYNCINVDEIDIPTSVTEINEYALHNTGWYYKQKTNIIYVNNIAYSEKYGNDTCYIDEQTLKIAPYCFFDSKVKHIILPTSITHIGKSAFENCNRIKNITMPYDLEIIDDKAFAGCNNLDSITLNNTLDSLGQYVFSKCNNLIYIKLPSKLRGIGEGSFYRCENLNSIIIPDSIKHISAGMFSRCINLQRVKLPNMLREIQEYAFAGCFRLDSIILPNTCKNIGSKAFTHCYELNNIEFGKSSYKIGPLAFYRCESLYNVDIKSAQRIGYRAFGNCTLLTNINFGRTLQEIGHYAFQGCNNLFEINIPDSVKNIGRFAFADCNQLYKVNIGQSKTNISHHAFSNCSMLTQVTLGNNTKSLGEFTFSNCIALKEIILTDSIKIIPYGCFNNCYSLSYINLSNNITSIENQAFANCKSLQIKVLPKALKHIGNFAFKYCEQISEMIAPDSLRTIGYGAFQNCTNLNKIELNKELESIGDEAFKFCTSINYVTYAPINCHTHATEQPIFEYSDLPVTLLIEDGVKLIDNKIFSNMNTTNICIPFSVDKVGRYSFANSPSLLEIDINPSPHLEIDNTAFNNTAWKEMQDGEIIYLKNVAYQYQGDSLPTKLVFKQGTTSIAAGFMKRNNNLEEIELPESMVTIGNRAFEDCHNLQYINIPSTIEEIHEKAFARCYKLKGLSLPSSMTIIGNFAFEKCSKIDSIFLNDAEVEIGHGAFYNCNALKHANIGHNITRLGRMAFAYCTSLTSINSLNQSEIPTSITKIEFGTFFECRYLANKIILPEKLDSIEEQAFDRCQSIHSIELNPNLKQIDFSAFNNTSNFTRFIGKNSYFTVSNGMLLSINGDSLLMCPKGYTKKCIINKSVKVITKNSLYGCTNIHKIRGMYNVEVIEDKAFSGCISLRSIKIGAKTRYIGKNIFESCYELHTIEVDKNNQWYKAVDGVLYSFDMSTLIYCPRTKTGTFIIPHSVLHIADYAFNNCINLDKIIKHKKIETIGKDAFTGCKTE